jgi:hypothetical protein
MYADIVSGGPGSLGALPRKTRVVAWVPVYVEHHDLGLYLGGIEMQSADAGTPVQTSLPWDDRHDGEILTTLRAEGPEAHGGILIQAAWWLGLW